jgi:hypothetical protein
MEQTPLPPGWSKPLPEQMPRPSYWPAMLAFAMNLALIGPVTNMWLTLVGVVLFGFALAGWIREMAHE